MALPNDGAYNLLREVLSLKFFLLMRMVAVFLAENPAMLEQLTQQMYNERRQPVQNLCLSLTGTAAMTLQHVFNRPLDQLQGLQCVQAQTAPQEMLRALARMMARVMNQIQGQDRGEEWLALTLQLSADVRQKQEVAFGLLHGARADGGEGAGGAAAAAAVTPEAVLDLLWALPEQERGDWYWDTFREPLEGTETEQRTRAAERLGRLGRADRERCSSDLVQRVSTRQLAETLAQLKNDHEPMCRQAEQILADWNDFAFAGQNGVWASQAPADANVGLGAGVTHLGDVLPRGMDLYNRIGECLENIKNGAESRYLASIAQPGYRNALLTVYVVEQLINKTLCGHQQ